MSIKPALPAFATYAREDSGAHYERKNVDVVLLPGVVHSIDRTGSTRTVRGEKQGTYVIEGDYADLLIKEGVLSPCEADGSPIVGTQSVTASVTAVEASPAPAKKSTPPAAATPPAAPAAETAPAS